MTTNTLRPNGTVSSSSGWTLTGGASIHAITSDNSDASYIENGSSSVRSATLDLDTFTLPAGAATKTATVRARGSGVGARSSLRVADPVLGTLGTYSYVYHGAAIATQSGTPQAVSLTQAQIDSLRVLVDVGLASGGRLHEVYVDILYALKPTTAVTAPSGAVTTTTTPDITWTHTDGTDGGPQSRYRVKVFSAAQYGAGGFDPETSTSTYDSGEVVSGVTTQVPSALPNGGTWRAYVKTAQETNGVAQWADWAFSAFTTSYTLPAITSVTLTPDATNARITVLVTRTVALPTWDHCTVERSDDGGTTWVFVRGATDAAASGPTFSVIDYEAPFGTSVMYRARARSTVFTGANVSSSSTSISPTLAFLKDVANPAINMTLRIRQWPDDARGIRQGVHEVLSEDAPTVISDVRQTPRGQFVFTTRTAIEAAALRVLLARPFLLLQQLPTWDTPNRYFAIGVTTEQRAVHKVRPHRHWAVQFVEIDRIVE